MNVIIDRFEGDYAGCETEDRELINIERTKLPLDAKEGDMRMIEDNEIRIDLEETEERD